MDESAAEAPGALTGLRVIDLSEEIAGAYATKLLADAGADVIKLERPGGDPLRRWVASGTKLEPGRDAPLFQYLHAGKRSALADLETSAGLARVLALASDADIVFESFGAGAAERFGLTLDALHARNPRCSLVSISAWGGSGPWATRPATEFTLQSAVGSTAFRGLPERGPVAAGGRIGEWIAGTYAGVGAAFAWLSARRTGEGHHVDLSIFEALLLTMTIYHDLNSQFFDGPLAQMIETPSIEPAKDGWVGLCAVTGQQWKDFCTLIGQPAVGEDERFYDATARMRHLEFIHGIIRAYTREHTIAEIVETMSLMRIPANPLGDGRTLLEMEQFRARNVFVRNPAGFLQPRPPYRLHGRDSLHGHARTAVPPEIASAPALGEHEAEIARQLEDTPPRSREAVHSRPHGEARANALPLEGIRVLDLTAFWAGPVATSVLADMGADVLKVESIQRPDGMRFAGSLPGERMWEHNPIFHGANTGKRAITLKLDSEEGRALLLRLIERADVVVENYSVRVLENFGLGWDVIHEQNPRAILVRMPPFGLDGPWRDRVGFAMNIEQVSGLAWMTGYPDMPLVVRGCCDPVGGMHGVFALLLALEDRDRSGEGQLVEVPLVEPAIQIAAEQVIEWSAHGELLERQGNRGPVAAPQGIYSCRRGAEWIAIAVASDAQWAALCDALASAGGTKREAGSEHTGGAGKRASETGGSDGMHRGEGADRSDWSAWARDTTLASARGRRAAHDAIDEALGAWLRDRSAEEAADLLRAAGVPAQAVVNAHFVSPNPQLEHRGFFQTMEHAVAGKLRHPGLPMSFSGLPRALHPRPAPCLGQDNEAVLSGELGLTKEAIEALQAAGVIGTRPSFM